ncbi:MAG: AAA family ATPase [Fimbriimonadaceae bacterium]|nr:AAA family ATPase [Fimbriimonadaceae bacterium]
MQERLRDTPGSDKLVEVVLDYGRAVEARYLDGFTRWDDLPVSERDIDHVVKSLGAFAEDNRAGIERTLHRISAIRSRTGRIIGLTCRVGRALEGTIDVIDDIVRSGKSILLLGRPGVGKTTKLREVARVLADEASKRVVIVDTSNEIGGDGDIPHPAIGTARRMQVARVSEQHQVMIEAVENHMPEVVVIDEIGNEAEATAARTIAERGVQLIATAHGGSLENLMLNPSLSDLIGGIQTVTLSDDEAKRRGTQKSVLERKAPPTFDVVVELLDFDRLAIHNDVQTTVDLVLRGITPRPEIRVRTGPGAVEVVQQESGMDLPVPGFNERFPSLASRPAAFDDPPRRRNPDRAERSERSERTERADRTERPRDPAPKNPIRIYPYGIARTRLERAIREKGAAFVVTNDPAHADAVISLRNATGHKPSRLKEVPRAASSVSVKSNTFTQIAGALDELLRMKGQPNDTEVKALDEVQRAIEQVLATGRPIELSPADARTRRLQSQAIESRRLATEAVGRDPERRVRVLPLKSA